MDRHTTNIKMSHLQTKHHITHNTKKKGEEGRNYTNKGHKIEKDTGNPWKQLERNQTNNQ